MNTITIIQYYTRNLKQEDYCYRVSDDGSGNQTLDFFASPDLAEPTVAEMQAMEADALAWYAAPTTISYYEFWELLTFPLQVAVSNRAEVLRNQTPPDTGLKTLIGKTYDPTNMIDLANPAVTGDGGYFETFLTDLVVSGVLTQAQAAQWSSLQEVT